MRTECLLLGFHLLFVVLRFPANAEDCITTERKRPNLAMRRYQPKTTFCAQCQFQHRNLLLLPGMEPKNPKWKDCFSSTTNLQSVLFDSSPETFVFLVPAGDSEVEPETLTVVAESLGNVSVLLPENSSGGRLSKHCRSLSGTCYPLENLLPVLGQMRGGFRTEHETKDGYGWYDLEAEIDVGATLHRQLEKLVVELCKRDKSRNRLIEILKHPADTFPGKEDAMEDLKFGLSLKDILPVNSKSYDKNRPPKLGGQPTVVHFHVTVLSLDSINEESMTYVADIFLAQSWRDPRLRLPENMSEEYRILDVDWLHDIWRPDSFFKNAKQVTFHEISIPNHYVWLYHDKTLLYMSKLTLVLSCAMKFESYPHDIQVCSMMIESLSHTVQDLIFLWNTTDPLVLNPEIELPQLDISNNYTTDCTVQYSTGNFTCLAVVFTLKRRLGYHLLHTYIPSALIVVMSWISFWIKPEAIPARVTLGVTSLLTLATQNTQSQQSLPPVSYVKAIDIWMSSCSVFVFLSLMEFAIVNNYMGPISSKAMAGYSEEDLGTAVEDYRARGGLHAPLGKTPDNPTCYGKETALCIDRFSRYSMSKPGSKVIEAKRKLEEILKNGKTKGLSTGEMLRLPAVHKFLEKSGKNSGKSGCRHWTVFVGIVLASVYALNNHPLNGFLEFLLKLNHGNSKEFCAITMPDELVKIFRPPAPCSICDGLTEVEKISKLSPEVFEERYAYTGRPVVVTDGMANWTAQHVFGFEFFKKIYGRRMDQWRLYGCQFFPYKTEFKDLGEVFNMSADRAFVAPWYVGWDLEDFLDEEPMADSKEFFRIRITATEVIRKPFKMSNCDDEINQILRRHYERPYFLPATAETKRLDWIFMGSQGYGAPMHVDNVEHPSWQAQLRGRKKWSLRPPPECFYTCREVQVVVEPGEIIVLDTNRWYHSTLIVSEEMSITIGAEYD